MATPRFALKNPATVAVAIACYYTLSAARAGPAYDLSRTEGMNCFGGSAEAEKLLATQGFVVAAPWFRQIFEPYIKNPLPAFVTPDSAWHTYHALLEEGVKEMERAQSLRLAEFSRLLLSAAEAQATNGAPEFSAMAEYASLGLAFQDQGHRDSLAAGQKRLLESLLTGTTAVAAPIGFPLSPVQFRPQSFYIESPELKDFYAAHQWYACVDFRLSNERETTLALCLAWLVETKPELLALWKQLSEPYDSFVAPPEDGTVTSYNRTAKAILGAEFGPGGFRAHLSDIQKRLATNLPAPRINDQSLSPGEYAQFAINTKGFRLLPGRQLPCAVCFQYTVDPKIPGRMFPSGLDFLAASPVMRSAAARRALEGQFGKTAAQAVQKADCPPMPDSLYGRSMELLAKLQEPLPARVPQPLRTEAWADLLVWTQLGAWSEQRHTWALYTKNPAYYAGDAVSPPGIVAPYPKFFAGLARLSRDTAKVLKGRAPGALNGFAGVCDRLAELARKQLAGTPLDRDDANWVRDYGKTLAAYHGYVGNSWLVPLDDFSLVTRIFDNPLVGSVLYAGVARPQALYVILPFKGKLQLYRGAVLSYREFVRPEDESFDDKSWREMVKQGKAPSPPPFTRSFLRTDAPSADEKEKARAAEPPVKTGPRPKIKLAVKEVDLGPKPNQWVRHEAWVIPSDDCRHVAYRARTGGKWMIVRDGVAGKEYDDVGDVSFSPDNEHLVYVARTGDRWCVVLDGVEGKPYAGVSLSPFAAEGSRVAYAASIQAGKECVVVDGAEGPVFDKIVPGSFRFSESSKHFAYAASRGTRAVIVKDSQVVLEADDVLQNQQLREANCLFLSPDGNRLAGLVREGDHWFAVVDGAKSRPWDQIHDLGGPEEPSAGFSPDGRHFTYVGIREEKEFVVVDKKESASGWPERAVFSPEGKHTAFVRAREKPEQDLVSCVVLDGVAGKEFKGEIEGLVFSPDGRKLAYRVSERLGVEYVAVHGGAAFVDYPARGDIIFSPDSRHMAFLAGKYGKTFFIVDGQEHLKSEGPRGDGFRSDEFTFSPDSKRWAYVAQHKDEQYAVVSDLEYGPFDFLSVPDEEAHIEFSPDSRHFAFMATRDSFRTNYWGRQYLVVDGLEHEIQGSWLSEGLLRFDSPTRLHGLVMGKERLSRLEAEILEK